MFDDDVRLYITDLALSAYEQAATDHTELSAGAIEILRKIDAGGSMSKSWSPSPLSVEFLWDSVLKVNRQCQKALTDPDTLDEDERDFWVDLYADNIKLRKALMRITH